MVALADGKTAVDQPCRDVHEVSIVDIGRVHELLEGKVARRVGHAEGRDAGQHLVRISKDRTP